MANFDPFESGAIALDEVPSQPAFDPFAVGAIEEPSSPAFFQTAAEEEGATKGRLRSAGASFMQGGGVGTGQTVSGLARLGDMLAAGYINDAGARQASANPKIASELMAEGRRLYNRTPEERERDIAANPATKFGQELVAGAKEAFPENPKFRGEFFASTIPSSAGQIVPTVAAGMVNPALAAGQYGLSAGQSGAEESIAAGDLADADKVFLSYLGLGAISELALGVPANVVRYLRAARAGGVDRAVARETIKRLVAKGAVREAGQESLEQIGQNVVAQQTFDPSRQTMAGVPESAAAGALLGGAVAGGAAATGAAGEYLQSQRREQNAQSQTRNVQESQSKGENQAVGSVPPFFLQPAESETSTEDAPVIPQPQSQVVVIPPSLPAIEPEVARQRLWQNMQGREMDIPAAQWLQPASPHLRLVLGASAPSWRDLNFSGVVTANKNPEGSYRVKVIPRTAEQVAPSSEPRTATATEQPTNIPVSGEPNAPPPLVTETPVLGGAEADLPAQQREQSRRNNEAQAAQMRAELEAMGVTVPEKPATPVASQASEPWKMTFPQWMNKGERQIQMSGRAEVAQPTPEPRIRLNIETMDGGKIVSANPYFLPGYRGPTLAVVEYKSPKGRPQERGYRVYAKDSGVLIEDSNGVSTLNETLKQAVQRVGNYASKTGQTGFQMVHRQILQRAIREGKPVPSEALKDYPDLQPSTPTPSAKPKPVELAIETPVVEPEPKPAAGVAPVATQLLTEAVQRGSDIYLSFDITGGVPAAQELTERFKSLGHDVEFVQFEANLLSTSSGVVKFRGTAADEGGRHSTAIAQKAFREAFGQSDDIRVKSKTEAIPLAERFGKSLKYYAEREAGILPTRPRQSTPTAPALPAPDESPDAPPPAPKPQTLADQAITKIEDLQKRLRGSGGDVSMGVPKAILDLALETARLALIASRTVAQAIDAAIAKIRESIPTFDEAEVRETLERELASGDAPQRDTVIDPATGERVPDAEGGGDIVNIAGQEFNIMGKDRMTPEQKAAAASRAQTYFRNELGLPGEPDNSAGTRRGSTDTNVVFKIQPDGENYDAAGEKLLAHLTEQIQMQHQPGGNPAYVSMLVNAINKNFNTGTLGRVLSRTMLDRLMNISVGESSWRASMLRAITGITEDMVSVARNPMFFLRRTHENMFGGELVRKIMDRIANNFGESFTGEEIERLYNANPKLQELFNKVVDRLKVKPSLKEVIQEIFATRVDKQDDIVQKFVDAMVNKFSATPDEASRLKAEFGNTFVKSFEAARVKAQAKALATLLPEERKVIGPGTPLWKKLTDLVNSGWFDSTQVVQEYARSKGMIIPTEAEVERIRAWSIKEQSLKEPTLEEIESNDANEAKAAAKVAAVTLETRQDLLRKMNTLWSRWTHPIIRNPRDVLDPVKRYNTAMAANEWLTANLLLKLGFGSRQLIDVGTQMVLHTPTRAAQYAFEQWANDKSAGRDANLLDNLSQAITDAYRTRLKVLGDTLASFKRTLRGRGEQKNVEQLLSSIGVFDRALLKADEMKAEGRPAAARFLHLLALTLRFGRQFAAAADVIQGVPAEAQEMAHQIRTGLREQGKSKAQQDLEFNTILGLLTTARVESLSEARQMLELRGLDTGKTSVQRAAWHILREKIYEMARNAGLPADEWKAQNHYFRNVIGWNEPETQGLGRGKIGGPGGLVALTARAGKEVFAGAGLPAFPFVFGNAMGISLNRKLAYTPLGFWTSLFKGSPWFEGERNIRQRKIEAVIGTTIGSTLFTLAALGLWVVLPRKWPDDEKEKAKWTSNGWQPGMVIIPAGDQEMKISTRVGPMSLLSPYLAAGGALRDAFTERAEKQAVLDERAQKLGLTAEKLEGLDASQWLNVVGSAAYNAAMGGRTASGMLGTYTDFGTFSPKKTGAAIVSGLTPGLPGYQEIARMAGANINPKLASFWDLLVPLPTSDANRVNLLGDPMRNENDVERVLQVLSGGSSPLPANSDQFKKNKAYANLFASDFRPPSINPTRGYQFGNELRPMTEPELQRYTTARGKNFATELQGVNVNGLPPEEAKKVVQQAFQRANASALESVGATLTAQARTAGATSAQPSASSLSSPATRRTPTGRLRASLSRRTRAPSLGRVRSRLGRTRLATMRVPRLRRSRLRASLSRPRRGRFSVRSRMARTRRPRVRYV